MRISLRLFVTAVTALVLLCAVVTGGLFWYLNQASNETTRSLVEAVESLGVSHELRRALAHHRRLVLLNGKQSADSNEPSMEQTEHDIRVTVDRLFYYVGSETERELTEKVKDTSLSYLEEYRSMQARGLSSAKIYQDQMDSFDQTQDSLHALINFNLQETQGIEKQNEAQNRTNLFSLTTALLLLALVVSVLLWGFRTLIYNPILQFKDHIDHFQLGAQQKELKSLTSAVEVEDIFKSFVDLSERLSKQKEQQLKFLASIAHDLKNPLSAIKMAADILSHEDNLSQDNLKMLSIMGKQSEHLSRLVGDLLDTARVEAGNLSFHFARFNLGKTLRECALLYQSLSSSHTIEMNLPAEPVWVQADEQRIIQVINNLLSNALKYTPGGGLIQVSLRKDNQRALISVKDSGIGILPEDLDGIFEPFRRSSTTKDSFPGVGLGLSAARKIMRGHAGGSLTVISRPGQGSTFTLGLQLASVQATSDINQTYL